MHRLVRSLFGLIVLAGLAALSASFLHQDHLHMPTATDSPPLGLFAPELAANPSSIGPCRVRELAATNRASCTAGRPDPKRFPSSALLEAARRHAVAGTASRQPLPWTAR